MGGLIALFLGAAFVLLVLAVGGQRDAGRLALRSQEAITAGSDLEKTVISLENGLRGYVASGNDRQLDPYRAGLDAYSRQVRKLEQLVSDVPSQQAQVRAIRGQIDDYVNLWATPLLDLARQRRAVAQSVSVTGTGRMRIDELRSSFARLFAQEQALAIKREKSAEKTSSRAIAAGWGGLVLVLVLAAAASYYLRRLVVRPVLTVAEASRRLAEGDMSARVPPVRDDEIGDLARAFNSMADSLESSSEALAERSRELERSNRELEQFASVTSHDLQAPLATISMYAQLLEQRHARELNGGQQLVDGINAATVKARTLIRDLLEYSRAGRGELLSEPVEMKDLAGEALEMLAGPIEQSRADVSVGELPVILGDARKLRQVFLNLIGNALKFAEDTPVVHVSAEVQGGTAIFAVADNGIGMDPGQAERIFQPFHRLHSEEDYPGTGIGLAVCERIIEQHGGRIWAQSAPRQGSTFRFTLPVAGRRRSSMASFEGGAGA
ncbi:MAG TPA: ATP-binding protein [Thermoleophilaceae bacterium]|nr:ATP-binding protein [Thermoleophilaceae bacterium]